MSNAKMILIQVCAVAGLAAATVAVARPDAPRFPIDLTALEQQQAERFTAADGNGDGLIDLAEFEAVDFKPRQDRGKKRKHKRAKRWQQQGSDTAAANAERRAGKRAEREERRAAMREAMQAELFALLDTNDDGVLSDAEHAAQTRETRKSARRRAMFKRLDTDQDQRLSRAELPSMVERLRAADADGDGTVTRQEMRSHRQAKRAQS